MVEYVKHRGCGARSGVRCLANEAVNCATKGSLSELRPLCALRIGVQYKAKHSRNCACTQMQLAEV